MRDDPCITIGYLSKFLFICMVDKLFITSQTMETRVHFLTSPCKCQASVWEEHSSEGVNLQSPGKICPLMLSNLRWKKPTSISNYKAIHLIISDGGRNPINWPSAVTALQREHWSRGSVLYMSTVSHRRCWMIEIAAADVWHLLM